MISQERFFLFPAENVLEDVRAAEWSVTVLEQNLIARIRNAKTMYIFPDGKKLVSAVIGPAEITEFQAVTGMEDIFSMEAVAVLGIGEFYVGMTLQDIFDRWPELEGQEDVGTDEYGNIIYRDIIPREAIWNGFPRV